MGIEDLSEAEIAALRWLKEGHCALISFIPDKTSRDAVGLITPGMSIFKKLEKKGLCYQTIEDPVCFTDDPDEEPFHFTPSIELTEEGLKLVQQIH